MLQRLLTLNERIDDLKCVERSSSECACSQQHSFYSGEEFYDDYYDDISDGIDTYSGKYPSPSSLSLFQETNPPSMPTQEDSKGISGSMCSGLDVVIDVTADSDYEEAFIPEVTKPFILTPGGEDEGYSTEQRSDRTASLIVT